MTGSRRAVPTPRPPLLPDPDTSWAVLVGVSTYRELSPVPPAVYSAHRLAEALSGPDGLLDPARTIVLADPQSSDEVLKAVHRAAQAANSLLLFCYVGHGERPQNDDGSLYFALPGTESEHVPRTSLDSAGVFRELHRSPAQHRVALLDCCYSGRALDIPAAADVHLLTAADRGRRALYPPKGDLTCFTAEILSFLAEGVPDGPAYLDLAELHRRLSVTLGQVPEGFKKGTLAPNPVQRTIGPSGDLALARNPAHGTGLTREGLLARGRFAYQVSDVRHVRQAWRAVQAEHLMAGIATDAAFALGPHDPTTLRLRYAHAATVDASTGPAAAAAQLAPLLHEMRQFLPADDPLLAEAATTLATWRASTPTATATQ
ncbi:caspase domain-containing protein [Kitasatospora sp. SolWspMP-SS2h]|uniref:caspase family protein n=1 Tax=Kitasatospora sp. SolWspMP-SS2h TaxID=1305729 RepID=UPI000DBFD55F|nr:caspase family protein [Kitasatospora sp. SolWspMP-SS2h]RAJ38579.1 caspase domain-containing protein [Kitasatospora sp. SolWspMP-SS2h]